MILRAAMRPHADTDAEPTPLEVECDDFAAGRQQLHAQVPEGWDLLHIRTA